MSNIHTRSIVSYDTVRRERYLGRHFPTSLPVETVAPVETSVITLSNQLATVRMALLPCCSCEGWTVDEKGAL